MFEKIELMTQGFKIYFQSFTMILNLKMVTVWWNN